MNIKRTAKGSVRWRIILIYFLLVFIAMTIVSVYLMGNIEKYQLNSLKQNIASNINESNLLSTLGRYDDLLLHKEEVSDILDASWISSASEEVSVVAKSMIIVASSNDTLVGKSAAAVLDADILAAALNGKTAESQTEMDSLDVLSMTFPVENQQSGRPIAAIYVRADLSSINAFIVSSRTIFFRAIIIALLVTIVLGFILARSITVPINDVTNTIQKMYQGDFSEDVAVKSDDEIGQLAEMFNILRAKLDATLEEISQEKNKLGTILEFMADGLVAIDLKGKLLHINPAARAMLDIADDANLENANYDDVMGDMPDEFSLSRLIGGKKKEGGEGVFERQGRIFALRYDRFKDEDGDEIGIIVILQDITERQKLEDMQTDFVANVSHELKTPLTNIKSYTETLLDGALEDTETADHFLQIINSEADRMNRLVKDLLQLSRLDNKQEILAPKQTSAIVLIDTAVTKVELVAKEKKQQLNRLYDKEADIRINVDRDRFEQVILNLLSNAIKYTNEGGRIDVDVFAQDGLAKIIVEDNGIGMSAEALPRIFERFYRVDKARSRAMGGTGLGLAITKQIVEGHGGTITAESQEGKGTKMIIEMPLANRRGVRNID
ncbi:MAG: cell wall metabolism sensor histidine kinase WalK [Clostridia bacterium]|nr:cell wall metabolism sensor histidine kinase WalK [Clostridia bacterium]